MTIYSSIALHLSVVKAKPLRGCLDLYISNIYSDQKHFNHHWASPSFDVTNAIQS